MGHGFPRGLGSSALLLPRSFCPRRVLQLLCYVLCPELGSGVGHCRQGDNSLDKRRVGTGGGMPAAKGRASVLWLDRGDPSALWAYPGECLCRSCVPLSTVFNPSDP